MSQVQLQLRNIGASSTTEVDDDNPLPVKVSAQPSTTGNRTSVTGSSTSVPLLASNTLRLSVVIVNESAATLYISYGPTASLTSYTYAIAPSGTWEMPFRYLGRIDAIWSSATGAARVTELI